MKKDRTFSAGSAHERIEPGGHHGGEPQEHVAKRPRTADGASLLLVLNGSPPSDRVLRYVAEISRTAQKLRVGVLQLLPPFPPELLGHGGAASRAKKQFREHALQDHQQEWISSARKAAERDLHRAVATLRRAGLREETIETFYGQARKSAEDAIALVIETAHERAFDTVVVGLSPASAAHESFGRRLAAEVLRREIGLSVWAIA